jgi:hypothetical protein
VLLPVPVLFPVSVVLVASVELLPKRCVVNAFGSVRLYYMRTPGSCCDQLICSPNNEQWLVGVSLTL